MLMSRAIGALERSSGTIGTKQSSFFWVHPGRSGTNAVQFFTRAAGIPVDRTSLPRGQITDDRGPSIDGNKGGIRQPSLAADEPGPGAHSNPYSGDLRR